MQPHAARNGGQHEAQHESVLDKGAHWLGLSAGDLSHHGHDRLDTPAGRGRRTGRLSGAPRDEIAVLANRGLDELIQDVIDGVADEPRLERECVAVRLL